MITIDGPAASGKTSVSRILAAKLGWKWVSTGAFYRGLAYISKLEGVDPKDEVALVKLIDDRSWRVELGDEITQFYWRDQEVTEEIYKEEVGTIASKISQHPEVRSKLLQFQRACVENVPGLVAEGRDCGTVVFPEADLKVYLTARSESRASRRAQQQGLEADALLQQQQKRDQADSSRKVAPLQVPEGGHVIDTGPYNLDEVVSQVELLVKNKGLMS